jgi:hypothetical protein
MHRPSRLPSSNAKSSNSTAFDNLDRTIQIRGATDREYSTLNYAFDYYNRILFGAELPQCLITLATRRQGVLGYFCAQAFRSRRDKSVIDEVALNLRGLCGRGDMEILDTLVHEMCHLWQHNYGKPGRRGYHNREWAAMMEKVGLMPSTTGRPGGKRTGQSVSDYAVIGGRFDRATKRLLNSGFLIGWEANESKIQSQAGRPPKSKEKFWCHICYQGAWAKPSASLICGKCHVPLRSAAAASDCPTAFP